MKSPVLSILAALVATKKKQAEELARSAYNRRSVLTGMYGAKGCGGQ